MTVERFEEIKEKVEKLKENKNKAQGVIDNILQTLKNDFGFDSDDPIAEAEAEIERLKKKIKESDERLEEISEEIEEIADWDNIDE